MDIEALTSIAIVVVVVLAVMFTGRREWFSSIGAALFFVSPVVGRVLSATPANYWQAVAAPFLLRKNWDLLRHPVVLSFLALGLWNGLVSLWSEQRIDAISNGVRQMAIALFIAGMFAMFRRDRGTLTTTLKWLAPLLIIQSIATTVFIVSPAAELAYLSSPLAVPLIGTDAAGIATGETNQNVESVTKAGGLLFLNGNRASMVMGVGAMTYFGLAVSTRKRWAWIVAGIATVGTVATLSKTGLALAVLAPFAVMVLRILVKRGSAATVALILGGALAAVALLGAAVLFASGRSATLEKALLPRTRLWGAAVDLWLQAPVQGNGYGAWEAWWYEVAYQWGINRYWPPHNAFLAEAARGGAIGVLLLIVICVAIIRQILRDVRTVNSPRERTIAALCLYAFLWAVFHCLGDNTDVWGTLNTVPFIGATMLIPQVTRVHTRRFRKEKALPVLGARHGSARRGRSSSLRSAM